MARALSASDFHSFQVRSWTQGACQARTPATCAMSNNPYMFIATEPVGPIWHQAGSDGKQLQNHAWPSWASNYVWIPSYIAYGLVDMGPLDAVAPITVVDGKGMNSLGLEKVQGKESSSKHQEGKSSLAPDELLDLALLWAFQ